MASNNDRSATLCAWSLPLVHDDSMRKRGTQEGSVRQKDGKWYGSYFRYVADLNGNLQYKRKEVALSATTKRAARAELREKYVSSANAQSSVPEGMATLRQFVEARFKPDHLTTLRQGGRIHYATQLKHLESLMDIRLSELTPMIVQRLITAKSTVLSSQSVRHIRNALSAILRHARDLEFIDGRLATESVKIPAKPAEQRRALTKDQAQNLLESLLPHHRAIVHFMLATGCRASEAAGLRWQDVNLTDSPIIVDGEVRLPYTVHFRHAWKFGQYAELKTKCARREVPLNSSLWVELQTLYENRRAGCDIVFTLCRTNLDPAPVDMHNFLKRVVKPAGEKLGIPWLNLHCLRHTTSTWLDVSGLSAGQRLSIMGHATLRNSMRYIHPEHEAQREMMEKATALPGGKVN